MRVDLGNRLQNYYVGQDKQLKSKTQKKMNEPIKKSENVTFNGKVEKFSLYAFLTAVSIFMVKKIHNAPDAVHNVPKVIEYYFDKNGKLTGKDLIDSAVNARTNEKLYPANLYCNENFSTDLLESVCGKNYSVTKIPLFSIDKLKPYIFRGDLASPGRKHDYPFDTIHQSFRDDITLGYLKMKADAWIKVVKSFDHILKGHYPDRRVDKVPTNIDESLKMLDGKRSEIDIDEWRLYSNGEVIN